MNVYVVIFLNIYIMDKNGYKNGFLMNKLEALEMFICRKVL